QFAAKTGEIGPTQIVCQYQHHVHLLRRMLRRLRRGSETTTGNSRHNHRAAAQEKHKIHCFTDDFVRLQSELRRARNAVPTSDSLKQPPGVVNPTAAAIESLKSSNDFVARETRTVAASF